MTKFLKNIFLEDSPISYRFDFVIIILILLNSFIFVLQTFNFNNNVTHFLNLADIILVTIFTIEIFLRFISSNNKIKYFKDIYNWLDIITIIPFWFGFSDYQIFRILRFFRLFRYSNKYLIHLSSNDSNNIEKIFILRILFVIFCILYLSSFLVLFFEKEVNPHINNFSDAFYFTLVTLTTVGFGDITAETQVGRFIVVFVIIVGLLVIPWNTGFLIKHIVFSNTKIKCVCPNCHLIYHDRDSKYCKNCGTKIYIPTNLR